MTAGDLVVIIAAFVLIIGFVVLVVVLLRVHDTLRDLRREVIELREQTSPLIAQMRASTDEARHDLERFDKVLGSAEAIGDAVGSTVAKSAFSSPAIKAAGFARGVSRAVAKLRGTALQDVGGAKVIDVTRGTEPRGTEQIEQRRRRA